MLEIYKGKKIFVTGYTGFKGSWLTWWLLKLGAEVYGFSLHPESLSRPNHFSILKLTDLKNRYVDELDERFDWKLKNNYQDIRNIFELEKSIKEFQPDLIIHMAAQPIVLESYAFPLNTYNININGLINVFEVCKVVDSIRGAVIITTDKVYENSNSQISKNESDKLGAADPYSTSKACCELISDSYREYFLHYLNRDFIVSTVRAGNVIGGGDWSSNRLIPDYIRATASNTEFYLRNPKSVRPYTYIADVLYGYLRVGEEILKGNSNVDTSFNFGPDEKNIINGEALINIARKVWSNPNVVINDASDNLEMSYLALNSSKANYFLKWKPLYDIKESIERTILWYKMYYENRIIWTDFQIDEYMDKVNK